MFACYRPLGPESDQKLAGKRLTHDTGVPAHSHPLRTHPAAARALGPRPHTRPLCSSLLESGLGLEFALFVSYPSPITPQPLASGRLTQPHGGDSHGRPFRVAAAHYWGFHPSPCAAQSTSPFGLSPTSHHRLPDARCTSLSVPSQLIYSFDSDSLLLRRVCRTCCTS